MKGLILICIMSLFFSGCSCSDNSSDTCSEEEVVDVKNIIIGNYEYKGTGYGDIIKVCVDGKSFLINASAEHIIQVFDAQNGRLVPETCILGTVVKPNLKREGSYE